MNQAREKAKAINCTNNLKQNILKMNMYANDYDDVMAMFNGNIPHGGISWIDTLNYADVTKSDEGDMTCPSTPTLAPTLQARPYNQIYGAWLSPSVLYPNAAVLDTDFRELSVKKIKQPLSKGNKMLKKYKSRLKIYNFSLLCKGMIIAALIFPFTLLFASSSKESLLPLRIQTYPADFQNGTCSIISGLPGILEFGITGDKHSVNSPLILEILLPDFIEPLEAAYKLPRYENGEFTTEKISKVGQNKYHITIPKHLRTSMRISGYRWENFLLVALKVKDNCANRDDIVKIRLLSGNKSSKIQSFNIKTLPALPEARMKTKRFRCDFSRPTALYFPNKYVANCYDTYLNSLVSKPLLGVHGWARRMPKKQFVKFQTLYDPILAVGLISKANMPFMHYFNLSRDKRRAKFVDFIVKGSNGQPLPDAKTSPVIEPWYVIADPDGLIWDELFPEHVRSMIKYIPNTKIIWWNYEPGYIYRAAASSKVNRTKFAQFAKLNNVPSLAEIKKKYAANWLKFRTWQHTKIIKKFVDSVHKHFPGKQAWICTEALFAGKRPVNPGCAVDPRKLDHFVDGFKNMFYSRGPQEFFKRASINAKPVINKQQIALLDPAERIPDFYSRYTAKSIKQSIVIAAAMGYDGFGIYPDVILDGNYYQRIAEGFNAVAYVEKLYTTIQKSRLLKTKIANTVKIQLRDKQYIQFPDFANNLQFMLHKSNHEYVITAFNFSADQTAIIEARIDKFSNVNASVTDVSTMINYCDAAPDKGFLFEVAPQGVAVIYIGKKIPASASITQSEMKKRLDKELIMIGKTQQNDRFVKTKGVIQWSILPVQQGLAICMNFLGAKVFVDPKHATVLGWNPSAGDILSCVKARGIIGDIIFHDKQQKHPVRFSLDGYKCEQSFAELQFSANIGSFSTAALLGNPLKGLEIRRIIRVDASNKLEIMTILKNNSPKKTTMTIDMRIKNMIYPGYQIRNLFYPSRMEKIAVQNNILGDKHIALMRPKSYLPFNCKRQEWNGEKISIDTSSKHGKEILTFSVGKNFSGVYFWRSELTPTVEPIIEKHELQYGQSIKLSYKLKINPSQ